jgi:hypothetical protein
MSRPKSYELAFFDSGDRIKGVMEIVRLIGQRCVNCPTDADAVDEIGSQCDCACLMDENCSSIMIKAVADSTEAGSSPSEEIRHE